MSKFTSENQPKTRKTRGKSKKTLLLEDYGSVFNNTTTGINPLQLLTVVTTKILQKENNTINELEILRKIGTDLLQYTLPSTKEQIIINTKNNVEEEVFIMDTMELIEKFKVQDRDNIGDKK